MAKKGETAPGFELPAVRNGEFEQVSLDEYVGDGVVILAFYPGDFNPACDGTTSGLDDLDLFSMQKDTTILAIAGDSLFSHRAFADEYGLDLPLLADTAGEVATAYGVAADDDRYTCHRAVFVVDNRKQIEYRWATDDIESRPPTEEIRAAIERIGDDRTALARYRVGHARYVEARRAFTSAMRAYGQREWMLASRDFAQATDEFDEAREEFNTAVRFSDDDEATRYFERGERKAEALWRAAGWLNDSASAFASGEGRRADELREDAEGPLETARDIHEPPSPDEFPPDGDPDQSADLLADDRSSAESLDLEDALAETGFEFDTTESGESPPSAGQAESDDPAGGEAAENASRSGDEPATAPAADDTPTAGSDSSEGDDQSEADIDEAELEAITAELEEKNETDGTVDTAEPSPSDDGDSEDVDDLDEGEIELELADPTDEDEDDSLDDPGGHGVPDSL